MNQHFIKKLEIQRFKCFDELFADGLKRVNLITGKNNAGKTALMEAINFYINSRSIADASESLKKLISRRQKTRSIELDIMHKDSSNMKLKINGNIIKVKFHNELNAEHMHSTHRRYDDADAPFLEISTNGDNKILPVNYILQGYSPMRRMRREFDEGNNCNFISSGISSDEEISILYGTMVESNAEHLLDDSLKLLDKDIVALKQIILKRGVTLKLLLKNKHSVLLSSMGEGVSKYIEIITAIWASKEGYLFIDELDNGIHHSKLDELWNMILTTSKKLNVQVFATTHSKECIESYVRVTKKLNEKKVALIRLNKRKDDSIFASVFDFKTLQDAIDQEHEVRG
ncbi:hypothetical protein SPONN_713 [uncultured Candidatus Thioglobus sp.]|nr:hypothetical protein SPONN_713 [uncultured Candidatus Thioglobus sp.]